MSMNVLCPEIPAPGFSFDLCARNDFLVKKGMEIPKATKTGTTLAACMYKDGIVIGADTRATEGAIVADKVCNKLHYLAPNMYAVGAGTAADCEMCMKMIQSQLELHRLNTGRTVPVNTAVTLLKQYLFRYQGYVSAAVIIAGYDSQGPYLCCISPHGSIMKLHYTSMGSGGMAAMSALETGWHADMNEEQAKKLVSDAICSGILNDSMSGSNVDLCIIRKNGCEVLQPYQQIGTRGTKSLNYKFPRGVTSVLETKIRPILVEEETVRRFELESMDVSS